MATRYWVGGAGNWSSTTKWSATSGGASGASVPISTDDVVFDANSGLVAAVATVDTAQTCATLTLTPGATIGFSTIAITASLTVTGLFSMSGTAGNQRFLIRGTTYGLATNFIVGSASGLSDLDFRDLFVTGAASPLSGTRIGNLRGVTGVTFSTPKTVYWNLAGAQNWSANGWAATSGGSPATTNFPLAQDTAVFDNTGSVTGTITMDAAIPYTGTVDMSARTSAMTLATTAFTIYGDWKNGSGTTLSGTTALTYSGRNTQTITSAGKTFTQPCTIDTYGGTVQLADALNIGISTLTVTNGTFTTNGYNVTAGSFSSSNSNVRAINLGASTVTIGQSTGLSFTTITNMTFSAGTSTMVFSAAGALFNSGGLIFNNVSFTATNAGSGIAMNGANTFSNLTYTAPGTAGLSTNSYSANQIITGTLTCAGATAVRRVFLQSATLGTQRTLTVGALSAQDCDFRDIVIAGAAAGSSPTRAGDCGGNSGITFPAAKTVYWNLAGAQNWSATGWCPSSGGTPDINQFPLAQDTAVVNDAGSITTLSINATWNIGTFNASGRTTAMAFRFISGSNVYGDWTWGSGVTPGADNTAVFFSKQGGTQTITSNGKTWGDRVQPNTANGGVLLLGDAFIASNTIQQQSGEFNANGFNVTCTAFESTITNFPRIVRMGSGIWTLTGANSPWSISSTNFTLYKGTANIVLSDTSTTARTFTGAGLSYNKLTIGGTTGISTTTISGNNQFTELASTKTVAHTIALDAGGTTTVGAWTVTGTVGNVVTLTGTSTIIVAGARVSGVDYLALGTTTLSTTSPGEFYAGANSTGGTGFILTAAPGAVTRYWVGGTGTWDATTTTNWSASSGGAGGASVPTSADAVVFDTSSSTANAAYTVTIGTNAVVRCAALTMNGPGAGNKITWSVGLGTPSMIVHGNFNLAGGTAEITRVYNANIVFSGSSTGKTITTNGVALASATTVDGVGCGWTLGSAFTNTSTFTVTNGAFDTANYGFTTSTIISVNSNSRTISLGSSAVTCNINSGTPINLSTATNLTLNSGTSTITIPGNTVTFAGGSQTFYNVSFTGNGTGTTTITGSNSFTGLSLIGITTAGLRTTSFSANQIVSGTLTIPAGTDATMRNFLQSDTIGTTRILTCGAFSGTDVDFRDITIAGAAAPVSGTRLGDCKGNSGITFGAGVNKYWRSALSANWASGSINWSLTDGGTGDVNYFPLAQDTCIFATYPNSAASSTINADYNIGTINMSARTSNTMTLATGSNVPVIYGNWVNGTGTTLTGTSGIVFAGRGSQTITSAGKTFTQSFTINTPGGSVSLTDNFVSTSTLNFQVISGTFDANTSNFTYAGPILGNAATAKVIAIGSGTWTLSGSGTVFNAGTSSATTVTGTGTIRLTSGSTKTFTGSGVSSFSGITIDQGGAGALTIGGNNTFKNITSSYSNTGNTTINFAATSTTLSQFTAAGTSGNLLAINGTSAASPATVIYTGGSTVNSNYLTINNVKAYATTSTWYAGANSTNGGTLGWIFTASPSVSYSRSFGWIIT